ncbi:MAG: hypothetical protein DHS20C21_08730 [Gemmatimonadota bacterium]|nr:MAG: hypothetical protein DHS20C21_08730 [Gemmatimonadota bacterium]
MKQISEGTARDAGRPRPVAWAVLLWMVAWVATAGAQSLDLPVPELTVEPSSRSVRITWPAIDGGVGRAITNIRPSGLADSIGVDVNMNPIFAEISDFEITGQYELDCDYYLELIKVSSTPGVNRNLRVQYQTFLNTSGSSGAVGSGILVIREPDTTYPFDPAVAGGLGMRFSPNVTQPSAPLGTIALSVGGMNSTNSVRKFYFVEALNTVSSLSQGLQARVVGPVDSPTLMPPFPGGTLVVTLPTITAPGTFPIQDGMSLTVTDGAVTAGERSSWEAHYAFSLRGKINANLQSFEGYHVWRGDLPNVDDFTLLGEIQATCNAERYQLVLLAGDELTESDVSFRYIAEEGLFEMFDRDIHNDFPYRYALSTFDRDFLGNPTDLTFDSERDESVKLYPASTARDEDAKAFVFPNPYNKTAAFQEGDRRVVFTNLPEECTIRIFTAAADHVATLVHGPGESGSISTTSRTWNLRTDVGRPVAAGIFMFYIEGTGAVSFQQSGKLIVVR